MPTHVAVARPLITIAFLQIDTRVIEHVDKCRHSGRAAITGHQDSQ